MKTCKARIRQFCHTNAEPNDRRTIAKTHAITSGDDRGSAEEKKNLKVLTYHDKKPFNHHDRKISWMSKFPQLIESTPQSTLRFRGVLDRQNRAILIIKEITQ